jgi:hypothetical protein
MLDNILEEAVDQHSHTLIQLGAFSAGEMWLMTTWRQKWLRKLQIV